MKWFEIKVLTSTEAIDLIANILYDIGVTGVVIEDPNDPIFSESYEGDWDYVDEEIYKFEYDCAVVKGYLTDTDFETKLNDIERALEELKLLEVESGSCEVKVAEVYEEDWANEWKKYFKPFKVTDNIVIKPTWETYDKEDGDIILEIDPGNAFGSGTHETTSMCIKLIEKYGVKGKKVFDIGCGTGILGISAAKLGAEKVVCVDIDDAAVNTSKENVLNNNVDDIVDVLKGNLNSVVDEKADLVVANIIADIIILLSETVGENLEKGGIFISSGIIDGKLEEVLTSLRENKFEILDILHEGEWCAIAATANN